MALGMERVLKPFVSLNRDNQIKWLRGNRIIHRGGVGGAGGALHVRPSACKVNPVRQAQRKLPCVLVHSWAHGPRPPLAAHSLMSPAVNRAIFINNCGQYDAGLAWLL